MKENPRNLNYIPRTAEVTLPIRDIISDRNIFLEEILIHVSGIMGD